MMRRYFFKMSEMNARINAGLNGETIVPINLYPETPEITDDYENNEVSDWWPVEHRWCPTDEFEYMEDAYAAYYDMESRAIFDRLFDR